MPDIKHLQIVEKELMDMITRIEKIKSFDEYKKTIRRLENKKDLYYYGDVKVKLLLRIHELMKIADNNINNQLLFVANTVSKKSSSSKT